MKTLGTGVFRMFLGGIDMEHWPKMGSKSPPSGNRLSWSTSTKNLSPDCKVTLLKRTPSCCFFLISSNVQESCGVFRNQSHMMRHSVKTITAQKIFFIRDFFSKHDRIHSLLFSANSLGNCSCRYYHGHHGFLFKKHKKEHISLMTGVSVIDFQTPSCHLIVQSHQ